MKCLICDEQLNYIDDGHLLIHKLNCEEYVKMFSEAKVEKNNIRWDNRNRSKLYIYFCKCCNRRFISSRERVYCSTSCRSKFSNPGSMRKGKTIKCIYGLDKSISWKINNSKANLGKKNHNPNGWGKGGYRNDLRNIWFRSTWEANVARILNYIGIKWEYERNRVFLEDCSFLIDFWLPDLEINIEVKGVGFKDNNKKLRQLYHQNPDYPIRIIDGESYRILKDRYSNLIDNWEN